MFTLWYAYLGYQEYRRRGLSLWAKLDSKQTPSKSVMDSSSATEKSENSDAGLSVKRDGKANNVVNSKQASSSELSAPSSKVTVKSTVSNFSEEYERKMPTAEPENNSTNLSNKSSLQGTVSETGYTSDEDVSDEDEPVLNAKDSRLLVANRSSSTDEGILNDSKVDKKKISFNDSEELTNESNLPDESRDDINADHVMSVSPTRSTNGRVLGRMLVEGADEPMRCWMTEGDHPNHPAGPNMCTNIKVISTRAKDSADSILRDTDDFILGERKVTKQISWPKKVSISDEPPTTFIRDIPPAESSEPEQESEPPLTKMKSEAELAAAAAAALKEDWRKKTDVETTDLDEDDKIIFGDVKIVEDGQILQISDDETSDSGPKEDIK